MGQPHIYISSMKERYIVVSGKYWVRPPKKCSDHAKAGVDRHSLVDLDQPDCNERTLIVLKYIANEEGRFVANRVAII